jgi:hypothetical protein
MMIKIVELARRLPWPLHVILTMMSNAVTAVGPKKELDKERCGQSMLGRKSL